MNREADYLGGMELARRAIHAFADGRDDEGHKHYRRRMRMIPDEAAQGGVEMAVRVIQKFADWRRVA